MSPHFHPEPVFVEFLAQRPSIPGPIRIISYEGAQEHARQLGIVLPNYLAQQYTLGIWVRQGPLGSMRNPIVLEDN